MIPRFILWALVALLCGFGLVMIASTTATLTGTKNVEAGAITYAFLYKQALAMACGVLGAWILARFIGTDGLRQQGWVVLALGATIAALVAVLAIGIFSAFIVYDLKRVKDGLETNYISATLNIYLDLYNIFQSLLAILGFANSRD